MTTDMFAGIPCRDCGVPALRLEYRLTANPAATYSLSGAQDKVAATTWPWCVCDHCGAECKGKSVD